MSPLGLRDGPRRVDRVERHDIGSPVVTARISYDTGPGPRHVGSGIDRVEASAFLDLERPESRSASYGDGTSDGAVRARCHRRYVGDSAGARTRDLEVQRLLRRFGLEQEEVADLVDQGIAADVVENVA